MSSTFLAAVVERLRDGQLDECHTHTRQTDVNADFGALSRRRSSFFSRDTQVSLAVLRFVGLMLLRRKGRQGERVVIGRSLNRAATFNKLKERSASFGDLTVDSSVFGTQSAAPISPSRVRSSSDSQPRVRDMKSNGKLGKGGFSTVWRAHHAPSGVEYALKVLSKSNVRCTADGALMVRRECAILSCCEAYCERFFLCRSFGFEQDAHSLYLVLEAGRAGSSARCLRIPYPRFGGLSP